jgi:hypothetical protein
VIFAKTKTGLHRIEMLAGTEKYYYFSNNESRFLIDSI